MNSQNSKFYYSEESKIPYGKKNAVAVTFYRLWELSTDHPYLIDRGADCSLDKLIDIEPRLLETPEQERKIAGY